MKTMSFQKTHTFSDLSQTLFLKSYLFTESVLEKRTVKACLVMAYGCLLISPSFGAVQGTMQAAVTELQKSLFGDGWVTVGKIAAAGVGAVMSIARSSATPFAMGAGVAGGLHFFQKHTESAAACLL